MADQHTSDIKITVGMDENRVPETISWDASDGGITDEKAKALIMSVWDDKTGDTLAINLWTKDMMLDDMKKFFHQTLLSMADTFQRATDDEKMALGQQIIHSLVIAEEGAKLLGREAELNGQIIGYDIANEYLRSALVDVFGKQFDQWKGLYDGGRSFGTHKFRFLVVYKVLWDQIRW